MVSITVLRIPDRRYQKTPISPPFALTLFICAILRTAECGNIIKATSQSSHVVCWCSTAMRVISAMRRERRFEGFEGSRMRLHNLNRLTSICYASY